MENLEEIINLEKITDFYTAYNIANKLFMENKLNLHKLNEKLKNNKLFLMYILKLDCHLFHQLEDCWKDDKDLALIAVYQDGLLLSCLSNRLKDDEDVVYMATQNTKSAIIFASQRLKNNLKYCY